MADGPSDFRSWQDELALNGEQEQQLLDRAMAEAQSTRGQADRELDDAGDEARQAQLREAAGGNVATTTLTGTGSYRDYLQLKQKAEGQYQAAVRGQNGVSGMIRRHRAKTSGVNDAWVEQGDLAEVREQRALKASASGAAGATRLAGEEKMRKEKSAQEAKDRAAFDRDNLQKFNDSITSKMKGFWDTQDRGRASFGFGPDNGFTVYDTDFSPTRDREGNAGIGLEDNQRLAQMARAQGLNSQADRYEAPASYVFGKRKTGGW